MISTKYTCDGCGATRTLNQTIGVDNIPWLVPVGMYGFCSVCVDEAARLLFEAVKAGEWTGQNNPIDVRYREPMRLD